MLNISNNLQNTRRTMSVRSAPRLVLVALSIFTLSITAEIGTASAQSDMVPSSPDQMRAVEVADSIFVLHGIAGFPDPQNRGLIANLGFVVTDAG